MRQRIGSLVLSVMAFFSAAHLTATQVILSTGNAEELADQLRQQGWHEVTPGVYQRQLGNQTETILIGQEGPLPLGCEGDFLSCSTDAYPLFPIFGIDGVGAKASASYSDTNNDCAVEGETYVYADAYVNDWDLSDYRNDAAASSPADPTAHTSAEFNLAGGPTCYSSATSSLSVPYQVSITCFSSYTCPAP